MGGRLWSLLGGVALLAACSKGTHAPVASTAPRATLEVARIDDRTDPLADVHDDRIVDGQGIRIQQEYAPTSEGGFQTRTHFARIVLRSGESKSAGAARLASWIDSLHLSLPSGGRYLFAEYREPGEPAASAVGGLRTYLVVGNSALTTADIENASLEEAPGGSFYVSLQLRAEGAKRFEALTRDWQGRRIAIVLNSEVHSAPVVQGIISGGRLALAMGARGSREEAKAIAVGLRSR